MCLISIVSALFAGVDGVWRSETGSCECVLSLCWVFVCACMFVYVFVCVCTSGTSVCYQLCLLSLQVWMECGGVRLGPVSVCVVCVLGVCVCVYVCVCVCLCVSSGTCV